MNESRFSNNFIEKRDLSYLESLAIWGFHILDNLGKDVVLNIKIYH